MVTLGDLAQAIDERTRNITDLVTITSSHPVAHGGYGAIWRGEYQGKTVAVKIPRQGEVPLEKFVIRELGSWAMTDHPNVLPLLGYCAEFDKSLRMVSPWMSNGTVLDFVQKHEDADPMKLIEGMARGLEYLHELNIVHGDLRCSNILISDEKEPVISDFGLSRHTLEMPASSSSHGSHRWRAPELHLPEKFGLTVEGAHAPPADIWSFGMTILELLTGEPPYHELETNSIVFNAITSGKIPKRP
ncbi:kinase-like protein, partial [Rickenella mellea]